MAEAASRTPKVNAAPSFCFRIIVIGGMGTGKSTLTKALCGNQTALAGVSDDGSGVTTTISSYPVKAEICKKLGVPQACILDVPGTGDPKLPVTKLIAQLEEALSAVELHAILLMNPAGDARINIATRIGTALLDKSFIESADQIVGVLTKADKERKKSREKAREVWGTALEGTFNHKIPVVMCSVPVMDEEPYDVLEPEQYEEYEYDPNRAPGMDEVLQSLKKIAAHPEVATYKQPGDEILVEVAQIVGVDIDDMQQQIKELEEERKKFALAQEELRKKLQKVEDDARREMLQMNRDRLVTFMKTKKQTDLWMSKEDVGEIVADRIYVIREYNATKMYVLLEDSLTNEKVRFSVRENIRNGKEVLEPLEQVTKEEVKGSVGKILMGLGLGVLGGGALALSAPITATAGAVAAGSALAASMGATLGLVGGEIIDEANAKTEYKKK